MTSGIPERRAAGRHLYRRIGPGYMRFYVMSPLCVSGHCQPKPIATLPLGFQRAPVTSVSALLPEETRQTAVGLIELQES
jgi:hypothetical protein